MQDVKPLNGCNTLVELCMTPGVKTVVSFSLVNGDNIEALKYITDQMRREGRLFFVEEGEERRLRPDDTWRSLEVIGDRFDGDGEAVACYSGVIHFKWRLTKEDHDFLSDEDWSLNSIVCHGNNDDDTFIVEVMTNMVCEPSLDDLLKTKTSVEFRCALAYFTEDDQAEEDWKSFNDHMSTRTSKKNGMLLWMRSGSSYHFFEKLDRNKLRFALDVFAYQKVGNRTRFFSGPVQFTERTDQLTKGDVNDFVTNKKLQIGVSFSVVTGLPWTNARFDDRWEFNAVKKKEKIAKPAYAPSNRGKDSAKEEPEHAEGNDGKESAEEEERLQEIRQIRQARQKRPKISIGEPNGLVLFESFGSNERRSASVEAVAQLSVNGLVSYRSMSDEVIVSPRRYLTQHDVVYKLMTKAADIAGFCREDDIRELFRYGLEGKQNLRWLYNHIGQIAKKSGPRQVSVLNASVQRVMYIMNNNTIGAMLFRLFLAPDVAEVKGAQMTVESIGANWQKKASLLKESLERSECVQCVNLFQNQMLDNWDLSTYARPLVEVWPDSKPCFDLFTCCLNICVDLFPYQLN